MRVASHSSCFGEAEHRPGQAAGPRAERRVALLRRRAAIVAVVRVEDAFVGRAAGHVVRVAAFAVPDVVAGRVRGVLDEPLQQADSLVALAHQHVAQADATSASARQERIVSTNSDCGPLNE